MPPSSLMDKARNLAGKSALLILPITAVTPAQTATLEPGYSFVGEHSSSGWFMSSGSFNDLAAGTVQNGAGVLLSANHTASDGMFWAWSDWAGETLRRYDVTGIAFAWGGSIGGTAYEDDLLRADYDFSIDFTHTAAGANDSAYVSWNLYIGTRSDPYTPQEYQRGPQGWSTYPISGSFDTAGRHTIQGNIASHVRSEDAGSGSSWFAMLVLDWRDTLYSRGGYPDGAASRNGDTLTVSTNAAAPIAVSLTATNVQAGQSFENSGSYTVSSTAPTYRVMGTVRNLLGGLFGVAGSAAVSEGGSFSNAGLLSVLGGASFQNQGSFQNLAGGSVDHGGALYNQLGGLFGNAGTFTNKAGASVENEGSFTNLLGGVFGGAGSFSNREGGVVSNAAGASFTNTGALYNAFGGLFGNAGTLANQGGGSITNSGTLNNLLGGAFGNAGHFENTGSGVVHNAAGATFTNTGTLSNQFGGLFGNAGTLVNAKGASFQNDGTFNGLFGGAVTNRGSFVNTSANTVNNDGSFDNHGELVNDTWGRFNNNGTLTNHAGATLTSTGEFNNSGTLANAGTLVVRKDVYVDGWDGTVYVYGGPFTNTGSISNSGTVAIEAGAAIEGSGSYTQSAGLTRVDGSLHAATLRFDGGQVEGAGTLGGTTVQNLGATFAPGGDGAFATLTIDGNYLQAVGGTLSMDLGGAGTQDTLFVLGDIALAGTLVLHFGADALADTPYLLLALGNGGSLSGAFTQVQSNRGNALLRYGTDGVSVTMLAAPVPEPTTWMLLASGLAAVGVAARRRRTPVPARA